MKAKIQKVDGTLAVCLPAAFAEESGFLENCEVDVSVVRGRLVIRGNGTKPSLEELLSRITDDNVHPETDTGAPVGAEEW